MPEREHDSLEEFFRKAAGRAEVTFNEEDWKKLEALLDAGTEKDAVATSGNNRIAAAVATILLLILTGVWWTGHYNERSHDGSPTGVVEKLPPAPTPAPPSDAQGVDPALDVVGKPESSVPDNMPAFEEPFREPLASEALSDLNRKRDQARVLPVEKGNENTVASEGAEDAPAEEASGMARNDEMVPVDKGREEVFEELIRIPVTDTLKIKQRADADLPGAEEEDTGEADAVAEQPPASRPRLTLLLSFAPDFSSTSHQYSSPGKAFGAMVHYHFLNRWSVSAGVIRNNKQYTGNGEDYTPPVGYWKYYTNGVVPNSIDGSCSVLEFPLAVQFTIATRSRHKWLASAGTSSYLMLDEQYRYYFDEPNPGAKEGWVSKGSSRFYFNMINFAVAYEYRVLPGLMLGIEPYMKIPIEAIGWTKIRLFSTGASVTLRYQLIGRNPALLRLRSRGPD